MSKKYKKGYTTGVYDMFHIGHLNVLKRSKEFCEYLVVGVTTDELCFERKHKYPIIPLSDRMQIIQELSSVDHVVPQTSMDKLTAVVEHDCDVVFVGDDWKGHPNWVQYEKEFNNIGVQVEYLPYTQQVSSTYLRDLFSKNNKAV